MSTIPLITSLDGFEIIRNAIAQILATETLNQQALATSANLDPDDWKLNVYLERSNPWEKFLQNPVTDKTPIVNVWYDNSNTNLGASNLTTRQTMPSVFNIDCLAYGESQPNGAGHIAGDEQASKNAHKTARLVRQILMHGKYKHLGLTGLVGQRYVQARNAYQPLDNNQSIERVMGTRIALSVSHNEYISLEDYETIEQAFIEMKYTPEGQVIASMDVNFT